MPHFLLPSLSPHTIWAFRAKNLLCPNVRKDVPQAKVRRGGHPKISKIDIFNSVASKLCVVQRSSNEQKCAPRSPACYGEDRIPTSQKDNIIKNIFDREKKKKKSQLFHTNCCSCFIYRAGRLSLTALDAHVSWAYNGIRQSIFGHWETTAWARQRRVVGDRKSTFPPCNL